MGSNQTILVLGGIILFSYLILSFNNASIIQLNMSLENEAIISATAVGQSIIEEIQTRAYDETTVSNYVGDTDDLSKQLGKDMGEATPNQFDDIDDFNDINRTETLGRLGDFTARIKVYYVNRNNPNSKSFSPTFSKRIDVTVKNLYLPDSVMITNVVSY